MSFSYSGAESGSFAVSGPMGPGQEGAAAIKLAGPRNVLIVAGVRMTSATHEDVLELWLPDISAPGSLSLDDTDCISPTLNCPLAFFGMNVSKDPTFDPNFYSDERSYFFSSGTVTVTFVSATRIAGTFAGSANSLTLEGPSRTVTVTNGKFDVSIMSLPER